MAAAHHREGIGMVEERAAGQQRDVLLAGIDQLVVLVAGLGRRAHAEHAVLAVQEDFLVGAEVVGHQGRHADAEVRVGAFGDVLGDALRHLIAGQSFHGGVLRVQAACAPSSAACTACGTSTTRCTKMPGVTICSGSSPPRSTTYETCTMVVLAALAITGPKLRAVLRYTRLPQRSPLKALISAKSAWTCVSNTYCLPSI